MNKKQHSDAASIRAAAKALVNKRANQVREESLMAFDQSGVPELFEDAGLVVGELNEIVGYVLDGCKQGIPRIRPFTESLIRRMLTVYAAFQYEVWAYNDKLTDEELLKLGMPTDDEESLVRYCKLSANDAQAIEKRKCHTAQQKVIKAFFNYVKASATFAKEIKSEKGVDRWVRAFAIVVRYDKDAEQPPYTIAAMDEVFSLISQANDETYVTWMIPELPTLAELRKEMGA